MPLGARARHAALRAQTSVCASGDCIMVGMCMALQRSGQPTGDTPRCVCARAHGVAFRCRRVGRRRLRATEQCLQVLVCALHAGVRSAAHMYIDEVRELCAGSSGMRRCTRIWGASRCALWTRLFCTSQLPVHLKGAPSSVLQGLVLLFAHFPGSGSKVQQILNNLPEDTTPPCPVMFGSCQVMVLACLACVLVRTRAHIRVCSCTIHAQANACMWTKPCMYAGEHLC